eukprot:GFUD01027249.1.p1 GENE.GFUD01027249.1~~GFUD01027249.1.p1  ORF type:complete len:199 (+),score=47.75 GFUD01027249.1:54-650(+)
MPWGGAPKCPACDRTVYPMEQVIAADRRPFHVNCVRCQSKGCGNDLTARSLHKYEGYNICDKCHEMIYIDKRYGPGDGMETMEERKKREEEERLARERAEKAKRERRCPECDQKTFDGDSEMLAPDLYYHKGCIKCKECSRQPDEDTPIMMAPRDQEDVFAAEILEPYCKFCYAKKFKTSAIKISEIVEIAPDTSYCI